MTAPSFFTRFGALDYLGGGKVASALSTTGIITVEPRDLLVVPFSITGYGGGGDIASLRFNNDSGNNYQSSYISGTAAAPPVLSNVFTGTTSLLRLAGVSLTTGREGVVILSNQTATNKVAKIAVFDIGAAAGTQSVHEIAGGGGWFNTTAQITSIEMLTAGGQTLTAGTGFSVFGFNF